MKDVTTAKLLRIHIGELDRARHQPLFELLVTEARTAGLSGATVLRGIESFGASSVVHRSRLLELSEDLPIVVELVDTVVSFFANTISFVRIAAFAAVHAGVFIAIFALADTIAALRFGGVLSIAVHVAGNVLVILLEGLTVSVQVLRLEYYEFFGKFFRGGGETYAPLTLRLRSERHA